MHFLPVGMTYSMCSYEWPIEEHEIWNMCIALFCHNHYHNLYKHFWYISGMYKISGTSRPVTKLWREADNTITVYVDRHTHVYGHLFSLKYLVLISQKGFCRSQMTNLTCQMVCVVPQNHLGELPENICKGQVL